MTTARELLEAARDGTATLTSTDRKRVLAYLDEHPELGYTDSDLVAWLGITQKRLEKDRQDLLRQYIASISPDKAMDYVGAYLRSHDDMIARARQGMMTAPVGSIAHQNYMRLLADLETKRIKLLQEIGIVPKELGTMTISQERWVATITDDGLPVVSKGLPPATTAIDGELVN